MRTCLIFLLLVLPALAQPRCPTVGERMNTVPDSDLLQWRMLRDISPSTLRWGLQAITQARQCERAGDFQRAANYYREATGILERALPEDKRNLLLSRADSLRGRSGFPIDPSRAQPIQPQSDGRQITESWGTSFDEFTRAVIAALSSHPTQAALTRFIGGRVTWMPAALRVSTDRPPGPVNGAFAVKVEFPEKSIYLKSIKVDILTVHRNQPGYDKYRVLPVPSVGSQPMTRDQFIRDAMDKDSKTGYRLAASIQSVNLETLIENRYWIVTTGLGNEQIVPVRLK
jgi:hypothetical protein